MDAEPIQQSDNPDLSDQGFFAGSDLQEPLDNLLATLDNKADVEEVNVPSRIKGSPRGIAGEGFDSLQVFDMDFYDRSLETSWTRLETAHNLKLPWETGMWDVIFGPSNRSSSISMPSLARPAVVSYSNSGPVTSPVEKRRRLAEVPQSWHQVVMVTDAASWRETSDAKMDTALKRWFDVVIHFPTSFQLVAQLAEVTSVAEQLRVMKDVLGSKSPLTLLKRVNSIIRYTKFLQSKGITAPGSESDFYAFLNHERDAGAPQSRLAAVVESIRFLEHVLGFLGTTDLLSKRCLGAARQPSSGPQKQASPLTVMELGALHKILAAGDENIWDRNMAGAFLCCLYTRSRWSDFQHSNLLVTDPNDDNPHFLELSIVDFKTKSANAWRGGLLAAVAPAVGVVDENWVVAWLSVRAEVQAQLSEGFPVMPAPDMAGRATVRPLSTKEASEWVRLLLSRTGLDPKGRKISSHSAKATMLSFLAKYGAEISVREILGAHVSHLKSVIRYSRDALAGPLRVLEQMLADVRSGYFNPDDTRSGYFNKEVVAGKQVSAEPVQCISDDEEAKVEEQQDQDDMVDSIDTGSSSDEEAAVTSRCARKVVVPKAPDGFKLFQHSKSRMLHLMSDDHTRVFQCGRLAGKKHAVSRGDTIRWDTPCCGRCWKAAGQTLGPRLE